MFEFLKKIPGFKNPERSLVTNTNTFKSKEYKNLSIEKKLELFSRGEVQVDKDLRIVDKDQETGI